MAKVFEYIYGSLVPLVENIGIIMKAQMESKLTAECKINHIEKGVITGLISLL
ncbi:hypothetical protein [Cytobacillus depressus]|uniref:hypothetical protein n=1 Tax=Cytobacillus depressus TaxID=1602942 RepID=UPI0014787449|nr:hypothetical protein [Cytobacillus depressus]